MDHHSGGEFGDDADEPDVEDGFGGGEFGEADTMTSEDGTGEAVFMGNASMICSTVWCFMCI